MAKRTTPHDPRVSHAKQGTRLVRSLRAHPDAERVPAMSDAEFVAFRADVAEHGIQQPLEISRDGFVLDGRHRLRAARELSVARVPVVMVSPDEPVEYMLRCALQRRHLSASQKAVVAHDFALCRDDRVRASLRSRANLKQHAAEVATLPPRGARTRELAAQVAGCSARTMQDVITVHAADRTLYERIRAGEIPAHKAARKLRQAQRYATITASPRLPRGTFEVIYADPPWQLGNPDSEYAPEQYYPTLPLEEIAALRVPAAEDALLYLWAVNSHLPDALAVMEAWGFDYRGCEVWVKPSIRMGVWTRNRHELLLIGRRGSASPAPRKRLLDSVIEAPSGAHSEKPAVVYERLEHLYPRRSKLELFARGTPRPGWTVWGNQLDDAEAA